ncbi:MAG: hypothetical protein AAGF11_14760 [Myxococcota bacterium]
MPVSLLVPWWLALAALAPSALAPDEVDAVELPWHRYEQLRDAGAHDAAAPGPRATRRTVRLAPVEGGWALETRWILRADTGGFLGQELLGAGIELRRATLDGARAPVISLPGGTMLAAWIEASPGQEIELDVRAFVPGDLDRRIELALMPAALGRLEAAIPGRVLAPIPPASGDEAPPVLDGGIVWSGASRLALELRDPSRTPPTRPTLAVAHAGLGLTFGDAELRGHAHVQWEVRQGSLTRVRATLADLGEDLTVEGRDVATWSRQGQTLEVELTAPVRGRVDLDLRWSQALPRSDEARLPVPRIEPEAWRCESSLQLARDGELEVIPEVSEWTAVASAALPSWGQGLVEGTPTAAYQRAGDSGVGHLDLLRFTPVPGPPTVVDVATYTLATTEEGRVLMKAYYELRNDRGAHLTVRPPPGMQIIGARVAGDTALPSRGEDNAWRIPLKRSLETVEGLLSFPAEVILMGEQEPWSRRERRQLALPTLDAPIAAARVTLYLPPRYRSRLEPGEHNVVPRFAQGEGLTYGRGVGDVSTVEADALFQEAVEGYMANDFGQAQAKLEQLEQLGVRNENMARLQSNIDVIEGRAASDDTSGSPSGGKDRGDRTLERRVKEQARARAIEQIQQQESLIAEAEQAASAGNYEQAKAQYRAAIDIGDDLAKLEQAESVEQDTKNAGLQSQLRTISAKSEKKKKKKKERKKTKGGRFKNKSASIPASSSTSGMTRAATLDPRPTDAPAPTPDIRVDPPTDDLRSAAAPGDDGVIADEDEDVWGGLAGTEVEEAEKAEETEKAEEARSEPVTPLVPEEPMPEPEPKPASVLAFEPIVRTNNELGQPVRRLFRRIGRRVRNARARKSERSARPERQVQMMSASDFAPQRPARPPPPPANAQDSQDLQNATALDHEIDGDQPMDSGEGPGQAPAPIERLAAPEVNASALSVVIPNTTTFVRYEQLLLDANETQTVTIDARRRLRR